MSFLDLGADNISTIAYFAQDNFRAFSLTCKTINELVKNGYIYAAWPKISNDNMLFIAFNGLPCNRRIDRVENNMLKWFRYVAFADPAKLAYGDMINMMFIPFETRVNLIKICAKKRGPTFAASMLKGLSLLREKDLETCNPLNAKVRREKIYDIALGTDNVAIINDVLDYCNELEDKTNGNGLILWHNPISTKDVFERCSVKTLCDMRDRFSQRYFIREIMLSRRMDVLNVIYNDIMRDELTEIIYHGFENIHSDYKDRWTFSYILSWLIRRKSLKPELKYVVAAVSYLSYNNAIGNFAIVEPIDSHLRHITARELLLYWIKRYGISYDDLDEMKGCNGLNFNQRRFMAELFSLIRNLSTRSNKAKKSIASIKHGINIISRTANWARLLMKIDGMLLLKQFLANLWQRTIEMTMQEIFFQAVKGGKAKCAKYLLGQYRYIITSQAYSGTFGFNYETSYTNNISASLPNDDYCKCYREAIDRYSFLPAMKDKSLNILTDLGL